MIEPLPVVDPEPYQLPATADPFLSDYPRRGERVCGAVPPDRVLTDLAARNAHQQWGVTGVTPCLLRPGHAPAGLELGHNSALAGTEARTWPGFPAHVTLWTWIGKRHLGQVVYE